MNIPLFKTMIRKEDIHAVSKVLMRGTYLACGPEIEEFEKKVAKYLKAKYVLAFNSGTSALTTLIQAYDLKGKEVIIPSFTFIATANAVVLAGGIPVFCDVEPDTFGLDHDDVRKKITKKTGAVMIMHYGGLAASNSFMIKKLCKEKGVLFLEDAAQSFGSSIGKKKTGTFGDGAIFSLCQNKVLSCGEGGLLVTNNRKVFEKARIIRNHGRPDKDLKDHFSKSKESNYLIPGHNLRLSTMQAAMGISQLKRIKENIFLRQTIAAFYKEGLKLYEVAFQSYPDGFNHVYQMFTIYVDDRDKLQKYLSKKGISTKVYFDPVHKKNLYKGYKSKGLGGTNDLAKHVLTIPLYPDMSLTEINHVINNIKRFYKE